MSEMIEAAARAMCVAEGVDPDRACHGLGKLIPRGETWPAWKVRVPYVRAAIRAIREPSEAMITAELSNLPEERPDDREIVVDIWQTMLDEAMRP